MAFPGTVRRGIASPQDSVRPHPSTLAKSRWRTTLPTSSSSSSGQGPTGWLGRGVGRKKAGYRSQLHPRRAAGTRRSSTIRSCRASFSRPFPLGTVAGLTVSDEPLGDAYAPQCCEPSFYGVDLFRKAESHLAPAL